MVDDAADQATPRRAKWWYVTFHNVTAMVGAGVLSLPYAMSELGWYGVFACMHDGSRCTHLLYD